MASVEEIIKKFGKEYKMNNLGMLANIKPTYERLSTGALGLDYPLFGGLPLGRICVFSGLQHSGKSTAACAVLVTLASRRRRRVILSSSSVKNLRHLLNSIWLTPLHRQAAA